MTERLIWRDMDFFSNGLMLLFAVLAIFTLHMQIKEEEKYMEKRYGGAYRAYKEKVRRYL